MSILRVQGLFLLLFVCAPGGAQTVIRINQLGYTPAQRKCAIYASVSPASVPASFAVCDALTDSVLWESRRVTNCGPWGPFALTCRLDFTPFRSTGGVYIRAGGARSPVFPVDDHVYDGASDFVLRYIRAQQCGYNPVLGDSCHTHDGFLTGDSLLEGRHADVVGGW
ncbi:MAG TPA: glycoside hydrolase family 9 protein, partial [Bacteroidota bacterium]|nr:glycoside hydrolase family 9 protein [Bacteroidota bacterium]